ncbi:metallo-beta-lactamase superfamily protein [Pseudonocardia hierapolitana]|uniref:Metallo-beta-lactamase superfamily protein n=1 Tax=Pseudonocardia hierapolitana TaxID=1128676 RepID=A0A561T407_9PSEU|nr:MBL fold metallo-hydrolase [Pseudonocardia hierapolitana]TWF81851.1 metallo-beta-lactamase superfamily protein [Pseudonocardia hierapolitana]
MTTIPTFNLLEPYRIAEETFVIPWALEAPPVGHFPMNSMVIRGAEPVLVDTGAPAVRPQWLEAAWSVVDPLDVKWVFLTHDDRDHAGNLLAVLAACPNATLLTTWFSIGRMADEWETPINRCRFVNEGDTIDVGDRTLVAKRPPLYDNPTTRALFDTKTNVVWSVDTFATNLPAPMPDIGELTDDEFRDGQFFGGRLVSPWYTLLDVGKFRAVVDDFQRVGAEVVAGCHAPVLGGRRVAEAFDLLRQLPDIPPWQEFTQADLDGWMEAAEGSVPPEQPRPSDT